MTMTIAITRNDHGNPPGKLADAELHFGAPSALYEILNAGDTRAALAPDLRAALNAAALQAEALAGLKLIGFAIWERRGGGGRNVTFPARQYSVNGERRSFALLRPIADANAQDNVRQAILDAYAASEEAPAAGVGQ